MKYAMFAIAALAVAVFVMANSSGGVTSALAQSTPPAPGSLSLANGPNPGEVSLTWNAVAGANYYRVGWIANADYLQTQAAGTNFLERFAFVDLAGKTAYTVTRLTPGEDYWFIVGSNETRYGEPAWSEWHLLTLNAATAPFCPTDTATVPLPTAPQGGDYDADNDGLIELRSLGQLDVIRYDMDGDGESSHPDYIAAFPGAVAGMGCPAAGCSGYELAADLDFDTNGNGGIDSGDAYYNLGKGWAPIGSEATKFNGTFDGGGHTISNLFIIRPNTNHVGLFGYLYPNSVIRNVELVDVDVTGSIMVGSLAGVNLGAIIGSSASGDVIGRSAHVGGLVGWNAGVIEDSSASVDVANGSESVGGLVGYNYTSGVIRGSSASGSVTSNSIYVGGLVGHNEGSIYGGSASGDVSGSQYVGGLVGYNNSSGIIRDSSASGDVSGANAGKLVGINQGVIS